MKYITVDAYNFYLKNIHAVMQIEEIQPVHLVELMYWMEQRAKDTAMPQVHMEILK